MTTSTSATNQPKSDTKPAPVTKPMTKPALVVFGTDSLGKPHASWFPAEEQEAAVKAAGVMRFSTLVVVSDEHVELARKLPRGRIFDGGKAFVPFVKHALYGKVTKLAADQNKADQPAVQGQDQAGSQTSEQPANTAAQGQPGPAAAAPADAPPTAGVPTRSSLHRRPKNWDEITVGDLVLAYDAEPEGWFDAIVLAVEGDLLRLRWLDYPLECIAPQRRDQLALLPPTA